MRGLAQALLLAPALAVAAPSRVESDKVQDVSPSTFVTFDIPPGFNEDQPRPYTLHLEVVEAPSPCAYPNIRVNDNPLSQGGHTLGRGTFAGDHDGSTFIASWTATCAGDEQLLLFNLESLAGRSLASDVSFTARFRQTSPASIIEVVGPVRVSTERPQQPPKPLPELDGHMPRPGDDEDGLLEDPPFPPPPHHHVGNHPDRPHPPPPPHHDPEVDAELREIDCLRHQLHALKHLIHEKESRLAHEHGIRPHRHGLRECDSLKCVLDTLMHSVGGGFRGGFHGFGGGHHRRPHGPPHGPPPTCGAFPFPGHGNHTHGNHTAPPPPPPPPGFCHCLPPPDGPPDGPPEPPHGPPPPFDEEPPHHGPPHHGGPPNDHGPPPPPPPPPGPPDDEHEHPLAPQDHRRPHPHSNHHHGSPPPPPPPPHHHMPLFAKISASVIFLVGFLFFLRARCSSRLADRRARRQRRREAREARKAAFTASVHALWTRIFADRRLDHATFDDEEKQAFLSGRYRSGSGSGASVCNAAAAATVDADDSYDEDSMSQEIVEFRNAATMVTEMVAAEENRARRQMLLAQQRQQRQQQQQQQQHQMRSMAPPSPTTAFAEYMGDDVLPTYDEAAPSVVVSDGFRSYSPGSSEYTPTAPSDGPQQVDDDVPGETTSKH